MQALFSATTTQQTLPVWQQKLLGNRTTSQGFMRDCYFLAALDALFTHPMATQALMQNIKPVDERRYWVKRCDGKTVWVNLDTEPDFPGRTKGPLAYQVMEAAYRDLPLHSIAPNPSSFTEGGYSVDVWLALLRHMPGTRAVQAGGSDWSTPLGNTSEGSLAESTLQSAALNAPPALMTASTCKWPKDKLVKSKDRYPGLNNQRCWVYKAFGQEWIPHHAYSVVKTEWDANNTFSITVDNPYLSQHQTKAQTRLTLPQFLHLFSRFDAFQMYSKVR
jgi:hypothetical protein